MRFALILATVLSFSSAFAGEDFESKATLKVWSGMQMSNLQLHGEVAEQLYQGLTTQAVSRGPDTISKVGENIRCTKEAATYTCSMLILNDTGTIGPDKDDVITQPAVGGGNAQ